MKESFHYMLMVTQAVFHKKLLTELQGTGLTLGQPKVLDYLREHDGSNQKAIAAACHIEPASLTSVLGGMEQKGLIERKSLNGNRRSLHVFLTQKGKEMVQYVEKEFSELEAQAFSELTVEERDAFLTAFHKIFETITAYERTNETWKN